MTDGGQDFNLGHVVGDTGPKGDKGDTGATGNGIQSIVLRSTSGKVKTYRITFTDGDYFDYQVTDGSDASVTIVTSWNSTTSDEKVPSEKLSKTSLDAKAPTSHASTSSTYGLGTTSNYGHVKTINGLTQSSHSNGTALSAYQGKVLKGLIDAKSDFSGSYNDLTDVPTSFTPASHDHDDRYYTESEVDTALDGKASSTHTHTISDVTNLQTNLNGKINTSDIANNLTTTSSGKVLDARQGKALADLIGDAITYINQ